MDGVNSGATGDSLTISHMNLLTLIWLKNIHPSLIDIVKTEYSLELRQNTQLTELVPRISVNIDNLLTRYDQNPTIKQCKEQSMYGNNETFSVSKIQRKQPNYQKYKKNSVKSRFVYSEVPVNPCQFNFITTTEGKVPINLIIY